MHIAGGMTALNLLRTVRVGLAGDPKHVLSYVERDEARAYAPAGGVDVPCDMTGSPLREGNSWFDDTFDEVGFPLESVRVTQRIPALYKDILGGWDEDNPLELCTFSERAWQKRKTTRIHVLDRRLPANALVMLERGFYVASPELVCAQLAQRLSAPQLALVIMELTGSWSLRPPGAPSGLGVTCYGLPPATTLERIVALAGRIHYLRGRKRLMQALDTALPNSASRPEAFVALMMSQPVENGGYGLGTPLLNPRIEVPDHAKGHVTQDAYYPDIYFQDHYVDLEYDSVEYHFDPQTIIASAIASGADTQDPNLFRMAYANKLIDDRRRARDLGALGVHVIPVTSKDIASVTALDHVAWAFACHLHRAEGFDIDAFENALSRPTNRTARIRLFNELA